MSKIRIGSIGIGGISNGVHIPGIQASKDLVLTAICDNDPAALDRARKRYGIDNAHCFLNYQDLIDCPDVDAIDISTPNDNHFNVAKAAIMSGKPYALEKPVTLTTEEADELAELTRRYGNKNMVYFSYRYKAASRYAKAIIESGELGEIYHVYGQFLQGWGATGFGGKMAPYAWRYEKKRTGSGALGDLGSHIIDLATFVTGKDFLEVCAHGETIVHEREKPDGSGMGKVDVDDFCHILAKMEDGVSGVFEVSRFASSRDHQRLEIYGKKGALIYTNHGLIRCGLEASIGSAYTDTQSMYELQIPAFYKADQMQSFADIVNDAGDGWSASIYDGRKNEHILAAVLKSMETGVWEDVK